MHGTRRHGMHLAEVIRMALHQFLPQRKRYIETGSVQQEPSYRMLSAAVTPGLLPAGGMINRMKNGRSADTVKERERKQR
jgi:hypothetical protein